MGPRPIEEIIAEQKEKEEAEKKAHQDAEAEANNDDTAKEDDAKNPKEEDTEEPEENNEEDEEKEAEELPPDPTQITTKYVISMDTLGDAQLYSKATVEWIDQNISKLEQALMRIDLNQYLKQREFE